MKLNQHIYGEFRIDSISINLTDRTKVQQMTIFTNTVKRSTGLAIYCRRKDNYKFNVYTTFISNNSKLICQQTVPSMKEYNKYLNSNDIHLLID